MLIRKNQNVLEPAERSAFVAAVLELKKRGVYDTFVQLHSDYMDGTVAHWTPSFLAWHRQLLIEFERQLQQVDADVTIPYWDWTTDGAPTSSIWDPTFLGGDGRLADDEVTTGPFAGAAGNWPIVVSADDGKTLRRSFGRFADAVLPTRADVATAMAKMVYDVAPWANDPASFRYTVEDLLHSPVHVWVGGQMIGGASPNDPVFWLHHSHIDKLWHDWQRTNPTAGYLPADPVPGFVHVDGLVPPWKTMTPRQLLDVSALYAYA
jgi:tyrosinase